jgi:tol-pal system protein YbgF
MMFRAGVAACTVLLALMLTPSQALALFGDDVARKQVAEQQKRLDELRQLTEGIAARLGRLEEEAAKTSQMLALAAKRQRDMYVDLDQRLRRFEQPPGAAASQPAVPALAESAKPPATAATANEENEAYERAQALRRAGNYAAAISAFQAFMTRYPKSTLAPRAQYWIGDSQFNLRDFKAAIASQQRLLSAYPDSSSVPDALLNMASAQIETGDAAAARKTMDGLIARFPASEAAEKARRRIGATR